MRAGRLLQVLLAVGVAAACSEPTSPDENTRVTIDPPEVYRTWWVDTEQCAGVTGVFSRVHWFVVDGFSQGPGLLGQWNDRHEITLKVTSWLDRDVVMHEILHELLDGDPHHEDTAWEACGLPIGIG